MFSPLIGNPLAKKLLESLVLTDHIAPTLLFSGPNGVGKKQFALAFAKKLLKEGARADLLLMTPDEKNDLHSIESIRNLILEATLPPLESTRRFFIIDEVEKMTPAASNALLKTLEEPPSQSHFILVTQGPDALLPTIVSRCQKIDFFPITFLELTTHFNDCKTLFLAEGSYVRAKELSSGIYDPIVALFTEWWDKQDPKSAEKLDETVSHQQLDFLFLLIIEKLKNEGRWDQNLATFLLKMQQALGHHVKLRTCLQRLSIELYRFSIILG